MEQEMDKLTNQIKKCTIQKKSVPQIKKLSLVEKRNLPGYSLESYGKHIDTIMMLANSNISNKEEYDLFIAKYKKDPFW